MSNLSLARIMYGSNEGPATLVWMYRGSQQPERLSVNCAGASRSGRWMSRLLTTLLANLASNLTSSTKSIS